MKNVKLLKYLIFLQNMYYLKQVLFAVITKLNNIKDFYLEKDIELL